MTPEVYSLILKKEAFLVMIVTSILLVVNALVSVKELGRVLGQGLKKVARFEKGF